MVFSRAGRSIVNTTIEDMSTEIASMLHLLFGRDPRRKNDQMFICSTDIEASAWPRLLAGFFCYIADQMKRVAER